MADAELCSFHSSGRAARTHTTAERIRACLYGIAVGDAVGKQTEGLSHHEVLRWYPDGIRGFEGHPGATIPRYSGNSKREWRIGETTDDTERTIAVARAVIADLAARCFPNQPLTIVPLALSLATLLRSAEDAILIAANVGGDSDSVASIAGGILGAMYPTTVRQQWIEIVEQINGHHIEAIAGELDRLRR